MPSQQHIMNLLRNTTPMILRRRLVAYSLLSSRSARLLPANFISKRGLQTHTIPSTTTKTVTIEQQLPQQPLISTPPTSKHYKKV